MKTPHSVKHPITCMKSVSNNCRDLTEWNQSIQFFFSTHPLSSHLWTNTTSTSSFCVGSVQCPSSCSCVGIHHLCHPVLSQVVPPTLFIQCVRDLWGQGYQFKPAPSTCPQTNTRVTQCLCGSQSGWFKPEVRVYDATEFLLFSVLRNSQELSGRLV